MIAVNSSKLMCPLCKIIAVKYKHLVIGGTFDLLHKGHEKFLAYAFKSANGVTIGLTSDAMASKKGNLYQNYKTRRTKIVKFLNNSGFKNWQIVKINDLFGIAHEDRTMDSILVSEETKSGAQKINNHRKSLGLKGLENLVFAQITAEDGKKISSGRIKNGEIDREGKSYLKALTEADTFKLPDNLRVRFSRPLGKLYKNVEEFISKNKDFNKLFVVGDASVTKFLSLKIKPALSIIDFRIGRQIVFSKILDLGFKKAQKYEIVKNSAGQITKQLVLAIQDNISSNKNLIKVNGEEDLTVLPIVLLAPLGSVVVYGQRNKGVIAINVSESTKKKFLTYLELFAKT